MRRVAGILSLLAVVLGGCGLAGDVTPPPELATAQALEPISPTSTPGPPRLDLPPVSPDPVAGASIYAEKCAACHGETGQGDGPQARNLPNPPTALGDPQLARRSKPAEWYAMVAQGKIESFMPGFASLSVGERWDVVAYALTLSTTQAELERGRELFEGECAACHASSGVAADAGPNLGDPAGMAQHALEDTVVLLVEEVEPDAHASSRALSEDDRWALASFVQNLAFAAPLQEPDLAPPEEPVAAEAVESSTTGAIIASVINGTDGAEIPEDLEITLHAFEGGREVVVGTATPDEAGSATFPELEVAPSRLYLLSTEHGGVRYASEPVHLQDNGQLLELPVMIYESTTDTRLVHVDQLHVLLDFSGEGVVQVIELWLLSNLGDRTLIAGGETPSLEIALPQGWKNLRFEEGGLGGRYQSTSRGFGDLAPLRPGRGSAQMVFSLELPYDRQLEFRQPLDYPVSAVTLLIPEGGPRVRGAEFEDKGMQETAGVKLRNYALGSRSAGEALVFTLTGRPRSSSQANVDGPWVGIASAMSLALALAVVGWWFGPWRNRTSGDSRGLVSGRTLSDGQDELLRQIASLDDAFEAGQLQEHSYHQRRRELKERLVDLMSRADD